MRCERRPHAGWLRAPLSHSFPPLPLRAASAARTPSALAPLPPSAAPERSPSFSRTLASICAATSGCSRRKSRAFSRPWPMRSPPKAYQAPVFSTIPCSDAMSISSPSLEMPVPYRMSNSASRNGGATLFFTTFTLVRLPITSSPCLMAPTRRMSRRRRVELERVAAGGGLGIPEQDPDLHADLVDEHDDRPRLGDRRGELAQRLRHEPGLETHLRLAHVALDLGAGYERGHRVDDQHVDRARAHQRIDDLERLLAVVGLGDEQVLGLHAELARVADVERVLGVDEGGDAAP